MLSNPNSTSLTNDVMRAIIAPLMQVTELHSQHTHYAGHARDICRGLSRDDFDLIVAVGGDGTVNEVINGLLGESLQQRRAPQELPAIAVIPTGSANVFARALGFPNDPVAAANMVAELIAENQYRRLPLGRVENHWFCVNTGFGIDAEVIDRMELLRKKKLKATPGAYLLVAVGAWLRMRRHKPTISFTAHSDGKTHTSQQLPVVMVSNTNPWTYAGPLPVILNPGANVAAGLSLYALRDIDGPGGAAALAHALGVGRRRWQLLRIDLREIRVDDIDSLVLTASEPLKWQVDGEACGEAKKLDVQSYHDVIDVISPKSNTNL
ncbi:Diacylglycerol kinase [Corynebacterium choanae]|uniref:Diacylglycerol kinase n=2 Tax=Corynebacterium choanae TaxID=1862358 RepID=A0A3G6J4B1_9CORY|nr:Diacylglycerol kinase [Corynebacterium choanae]